jgi:superfamily I DNA/RNA helicase
VRASHQMRAFEDRFLTIGLPYRVIGGPRFYERQEIRDAMAYFRLAVSPDDDLAFERVVNVPKRGLGDKAVQTIQMQAREDGVSLLEGARYLVAKGGSAARAPEQLRAFVEGGRPLAPATFHPEHDHIELAETILDESGYTGMWQNDKTPEAPGRLDNLKELVKALEQFDNLQGFLEHVALIMDNDTDEADREGLDHDPARRQGAGVSGRLPAGLGGRAVPQPAQHGRKRPEGAGGGAAAGLCRHHPGRGAVHDLLCRQPPGLWAVAIGSCPRASSMNCPPSMSRC